MKQLIILLTLLICNLTFYINNCVSQVWSPLGSGMDNYVDAFEIYNNELIAAGTFSWAGGVNAKCIAKWNGNTWTLLSSGFIYTGYTAQVGALTVYNGKLIAGGQFNLAGGLSANRIAKWDGTNWSPLGSGMNNTVVSLCVYNNELIAGGQFTTAGGNSANYIAKWDGTNWSPLGSGMNNAVYALTVYNGELIAGGQFTTAGGNSANYIAKWDGNSWSTLGSGLSGLCYVLTVYNNELIVGGTIVAAGGISVNKIAKWNGTSWSPLGSGLSGYSSAVFALTKSDSVLIAGGSFTTAGGITANYIAKWDGNSWSTLGSGMNNIVYALTVYNNELIAGGVFTTAGGVSANRIAKWETATGINPVNGEKPTTFSLSQNYPNPINPTTKIKFAIPMDSRFRGNDNVVLKVYNVIGKEVATLVNESLKPGTYEVEFDGSNLSSGTYFYRLQSGDFTDVKKLVLLK
jgi:hypothetical protein